MRTLIADDDSNVRGLVRRVLTRQFESLDIVECENGLAALELLTSGEFDLVLLDVSMPLMDGLDVLRSVRCAPVIGKVPVIMMTGHNDDHVIRQTLKLGISDFILKPIHPLQLCERVLKVLTRAPAADERKGPPRAAFRPLALAPTTTLLLADGSAEFRQFFSKVVSPRCPVHVVSSGLAAFQRCLEQPPYALFVGSELGILSGETLVRKLRALPRLCSVRLVGVEARSDLLQVRKRGTYEAAIIRSFVHEVFLEGFESLLRAPAACGVELPDVPDLKLLAISAAEESLSDSIGEHVILRPPSTRVMPAGATVTLLIGADSTPLRLRLAMPANGIERLVSLAQRQNLNADTPDAALAVLVERLAHNLTEELKGRNLIVSAEPATVTRGVSRRAGSSLDAEHGLALEFDVPNDKLSLRVTLVVDASRKSVVNLAAGSRRGAEPMGAIHRAI